MELSEEEKKAIDDLFALTHINGYIDLYTQKEAKIHTLDLSKWQNGVKVLLNLIEKQQKEIEDIKIRLQDTLSRQKNTLYFCIDDYVSKDKIREIFQFYIERDSLFNDDPHKMAVIKLKDVLEELLEED